MYVVRWMNISWCLKNRRKSNFAKVNTEELFRAVDLDNNGDISEEEWMEFWQEVKRAGHSEEEIEEEVKLFLD